jgi:hypothetical protein
MDGWKGMHVGVGWTLGASTRRREVRGGDVKERDLPLRRRDGCVSDTRRMVESHLV